MSGIDHASGMIQEVHPDEIYTLVALDFVVVGFETPESIANAGRIDSLLVLQAGDQVTGRGEGDGRGGRTTLRQCRAACSSRRGPGAMTITSERPAHSNVTQAMRRITAPHHA